MSKKKQFLLFILLFACLGVLVAQNYQITENELSTIEKENKQLLKQQQSLELLVKKLKGQSEELSKSLKMQQEKNGELSTSFNQLEIEKTETIQMMSNKIQKLQEQKSKWKNISVGFILLSIFLFAFIVFYFGFKYGFRR